MNQILCTDITQTAEYRENIKNEKLKKQNIKSNKLRFIDTKNLVSMIIVFMIIVLFSYCIYAYGLITKSDDEQNVIKENVVEETVEEVVKEPEYINATNILGIEHTEYSSESGDNFTVLAILYIPNLDIKYPVLSKNSEELMEISLNKYWGAEPNEKGNCVIVGHNYRNLTHFGKLPRIKIGDEVELTDTNGRTLTYVVYDKYEVDPSDVSCTTQLTDGRTEITLITCTNGGATRLVVRCVAIEK